MTLRPLVAAIALFATPVVLATGNASAEPCAGTATETTSANVAPRTPQAQRKVDRTRPGTPLKPRMIEAPGAAVMMIPASYDPMRMGPFSTF